MRVILLIFLLSLPSWAAPPTRAVLLVWDSGDTNQVERFGRLVKSLKDLRAQGQFDIVAGLDRSIKVYDYHKPAHAESLTRLNLVRKKETPFIAVVSMSPQGIPSSLMWGKKVVQPEPVMNELQRHFGLVVKAVPPALRPLASVPELPSSLPADGWVQNGDRWLHADGLSVVLPPGAVIVPKASSVIVRTDGKFFAHLCLATPAYRPELLAYIEQSTLSWYPGIALGAPQATQVGNLKITMREGVAVEGKAKPGAPPDAVFIGTVALFSRSIVFAATAPVVEGKSKDDRRAELTAILHTLKVH